MDGLELLKRLHERLGTDQALREEFERDPEAVLTRETGMTVGELAALAPLAEEELAAVTGGGGDNFPEWMTVTCDMCKKRVLIALYLFHWLECVTKNR